MKVLLAGRVDRDSSADDPVAAGLSEALRQAGCQVDHLGMSFARRGNAELKSLAGHRMTPVWNQCEALVCLDVHSTILHHPRKYACPVVDGFGALDGSFAGNVLLACVRECSGLVVTEAMPESFVGQLRSDAIHLERDSDFSDRELWAPFVARIKK